MRDPGPPRRVVVTGMGCITPLGLDLSSTWKAALAGRSAIGPIERFDAAELPVRIAGCVPGEAADWAPSGLEAKELRRLDLGVLFGLRAATEALAASGLDPDRVGRDRFGVALGSGISGLGTILRNHRTLLERGPRRVSPFTIPMGIANMPAGYASIHLGLRGPNLCHVSACASSAHALGEAARAVARGDAEAMLAGGTEAAVTDLAVAGFAAMRALSTRNHEPGRASRPFDRARDGFVMGEGAGALVLETLEAARARGAEVLAEVLGYGATADAAHPAAPQESGEGIVRCMRAALADAELAPEDVDHVNAHATSTPAGDPVEARALREVFGARVAALPVSATKSLTGHLLGAAGAVEAILSVQALRSGSMPPTANLEDPDPACELDHVAGAPREGRLRAVLSNSFGFGGTNASLVLGALDA